MTPPDISRPDHQGSALYSNGSQSAVESSWATRVRALPLVTSERGPVLWFSASCLHHSLFAGTPSRTKRTCSWWWTFSWAETSDTTCSKTCISRRAPSSCMCASWHLRLATCAAGALSTGENYFLFSPLGTYSPASCSPSTPFPPCSPGLRGRKLALD